MIIYKLLFPVESNNNINQKNQSKVQKNLTRTKFWLYQYQRITLFYLNALFLKKEEVNDDFSVLNLPF